jgi:hypothetical protein
MREIRIGDSSKLGVSSCFFLNFSNIFLFSRLLENRIGRLQDDLETSNLNANGGGMAIMMSSPKTSNKKPKDPNKPVSILNILPSFPKV